jgi:hypothetical protein
VVNIPTRVRLQPGGRYSTTVRKLPLVVAPHLLHRPLLPAAVVPAEMETEGMEFAPMDSVARSMVGVVQLRPIAAVAQPVPAAMETEATEFAPMDSAAPSMVGVVQLRPIAAVAQPVPAAMETEATEFAPMDSVAPVMAGVVQRRTIVLPVIFVGTKIRLRVPKK